MPQLRENRKIEIIVGRTCNNWTARLIKINEMEINTHIIILKIFTQADFVSVPAIVVTQYFSIYIYTSKYSKANLTAIEMVHNVNIDIWSQCPHII